MKIWITDEERLYNLHFIPHEEDITDGDKEIREFLELDNKNEWKIAKEDIFRYRQADFKMTKKEFDNLDVIVNKYQTAYDLYDFFLKNANDEDIYCFDEIANQDVENTKIINDIYNFLIEWLKSWATINYRKNLIRQYMEDKFHAEIIHIENGNPKFLEEEIQYIINDIYPQYDEDFETDQDIIDFLNDWTSGFYENEEEEIENE